MRLDKYLAVSSLGLRKTVREYIKAGLVSVNGQVILDPMMQINEEDRITCAGRLITYVGKTYYAFHKPAGCITARIDDRHKTIMEYFQSEDMNGIFPVGRLDKDTEGLLFLTNDGEFEYQLMHPKNHVEKEYFFWAYGELDDVGKAQLEHGLIIDVKGIPTTPAKIRVDKKGNYEELKKEMNLQYPPHTKTGCYEQPVFSGYLTISEGRKHQVKRMLKAVGCHIVYLKRISIGGVVLEDTLKKGAFRKLTQEEIDVLIKKQSAI